MPARGSVEAGERRNIRNRRFPLAMLITSQNGSKNWKFNFVSRKLLKV